MDTNQKILQEADFSLRQKWTESRKNTKARNKKYDDHIDLQALWNEEKIELKKHIDENTPDETIETMSLGAAISKAARQVVYNERVRIHFRPGGGKASFTKAPLPSIGHDKS